MLNSNYNFSEIVTRRRRVRSIWIWTTIATGPVPLAIGLCIAASRSLTGATGAEIVTPGIFPICAVGLLCLYIMMQLNSIWFGRELPTLKPSAASADSLLMDLIRASTICLPKERTNIFKMLTGALPLATDEALKSVGEAGWEFMCGGLSRNWRDNILGYSAMEIDAYRVELMYALMRRPPHKLGRYIQRRLARLKRSPNSSQELIELVNRYLDSVTSHPGFVEDGAQLLRSSTELHDPSELPRPINQAANSVNDDRELLRVEVEARPLRVAGESEQLDSTMANHMGVN